MKEQVTEHYLTPLTIMTPAGGQGVGTQPNLRMTERVWLSGAVIAGGMADPLYAWYRQRLFLFSRDGLRDREKAAQASPTLHRWVFSGVANPFSLLSLKAFRPSISKMGCGPNSPFSSN